MVEPIPPSARRNRADSVLARLRRDLLTGRYQPGDRLPPERELAARFGTNRNTLREALRTLESENLVRARQGDGTIVLDWRRQGEIPLLYSFLAEDTPAGERLDAVSALLRLRTLLIDDAAGLAVARADGEDYLALEGALEEMRHAAVGTPAVAADVAFWRALVLASHNLVLVWVFNTFARIFFELGRRFPMLWRLDQPYVDALGRIVDHLRAGRAREARAAMRRIFDERTAEIMKLLDESRASRPKPRPSTSRRSRASRAR
jgi:DNA-binding FadR family transcriptional regulator